MAAIHSLSPYPLPSSPARASSIARNALKRRNAGYPGLGTAERALWHSVPRALSPGPIGDAEGCSKSISLRVHGVGLRKGREREGRVGSVLAALLLISAAQ